MAEETTSAVRTTDSDPDQGSGEQESTADPPQVGTSVRRVPLDRLLSVAVLSPAQALLVAIQVLDAANMRGTANGTRPADACLWAVALTPSGDVEVGLAQAGEGSQVTELLEQLSQNASRLPAHPKPEQVVLLRRLEEAAAGLQLEPGARARELEDALAELLGSGARQRLSGQLAALVGAFAHIAASVAVSPEALGAPGRSRSDPHRAAPKRSKASRPTRGGQALSHRRARTRRTALVGLVLTAALASGGGYVVLRNPDIGQAGVLGGDNGPSESTTTAPSDSSQEPAKQPQSRPRQDVEALADRHAGPITGVEVQKADGCTPGAACPVTVTVHFRPASTTQSVVWKVGSARLCGSGITWSPPITVTAQPGWTTVYASSSVRLPRGRSLALVALTTAPARAQSPPVPVTGPSLRC